MSLLRRPPHDPELARAQLEHARVLAQLDRERQEAAAEAARRRAIAEDEERRRRDTARRTERAAARDRRRVARAEFGQRLRPVLPLLLINGGAAYAQAAYAFEEIAPADWNTPSKVAFAVAFAAAQESNSVFVQWHAHDALLLRAHATAANLRRASWVIAAVVGAINYAHFADGAKPTAAAVAFALLSLLSPWLWGLHTRRVQHVQLLAEDANLIDEAGVEFSPARRRAFPVRSWQARRWSIDHYERDPRRAWEGYNAERRAARAGRTAAAEEVGQQLAEQPVPAATPVPRPRWRAGVRRPRRMGRPQPHITVVLPEPKRAPAVAPQVAKPAAKLSGSATRPGRPSKAQKVASFAARMPEAKPSEIAKRAGVSEATVRRHLAGSAPINGKELSV